MNLLDEVKKRLSITGEYHNAMLLGFIDDVKQYMLSAGVNESIVNSKKAIGCISRGVLDLWTKETFSDLFSQRVIQLTFEPETDLELIPEVKQPDDNLDVGENEDVLPDNSDI